MPLTAAMLEELATREGILKFLGEGFSGEFSSFSLEEKRRCFLAMKPVVEIDSDPALHSLYGNFLRGFSVESCEVDVPVELLNAEGNQHIKNVLFLIAINAEKEMFTYAILTWLFRQKIFPSAPFVYGAISHMLENSDNNGALFLLMTLHTTQENNPFLAEFLKDRPAFFAKAQHQAALQAARQEEMRLERERAMHLEELRLAEIKAAMHRRMMLPVDATLEGQRVEAAQKNLGFGFFSACHNTLAVTAGNLVDDDDVERARASL